MSDPAGKAPIYSMTGYAHISGRANQMLAWSLTLKSVNHRFLDLHLRMPGGTEPLEMRLRRWLKDRIVRGHLEVTLSLDRGSGVECPARRPAPQGLRRNFSCRRQGEWIDRRARSQCAPPLPWSLGRRSALDRA